MTAIVASIQERRGTAAQWALSNPVLLAGQLAFTSDVFYGATDQQQFKVGDGVQTWSALDYMPVGSGGGGGSQTLAQTLALGNTTGTNDIVLTGTKELKTSNNTNKISLNGAVSGDIDVYSEGDLVLNTDGNIEIATFDVNVYANIRLQNETALEILATDANQRVKPLPVATYPSLTEIAYVKGVTSAIQTQLNSKEPAITATTSSDFWSGAKTFINFATTVRATVLTGLSLVSSTVISATDSVLIALGSLQAQITNLSSSLTGYFNKSTDDTDDITVGTTNKFATAAEKTKLGFITVTQAVDLDTIESDTTTNNAKVTNATHTSEVTGSGALTVDKTAITNKSIVTAVGTDYALISDTSDSGNLKKVLVSDFGASLIVANRQTASYTLVLTDASKLVEMNVATANNLTIPLNATVAFPIGTQILADATGAGQVTIVPIGGVTLNYTDTLKTRVQNSTLCLIKIGTDEWDISGDTEPLIAAIVQADIDNAMNIDFLLDYAQARGALYL